MSRKMPIPGYPVWHQALLPYLQAPIDKRHHQSEHHGRNPTINLGRSALVIFIVLNSLFFAFFCYKWSGQYRQTLKAFCEEPLCASWLQEAVSELESGRYEKAIALSDSLRKEYPSSSQAKEAARVRSRAQLGLAEQHLGAGRYKEAISCLDELLEDHSSSPEASRARQLYPQAQLGLAEQHLGAGRYKEAISCLDELLEDYSSSPEAARANQLYPQALLGLADQQAKQKEYVASLKTLERIISDHKGTPEASAAYRMRNDVYWMMLGDRKDRCYAEIGKRFPVRVVNKLSSITYRIRDSSERPKNTNFTGLFCNEGEIHVFKPDAFSSTHGLDSLLYHELGHALDAYYLSDSERNAYRQMRNIPMNIPWHNYDSNDFDEYDYERSPNEDFAEVFAVIITGDSWTSHTVYGEIKDRNAMMNWIIQACSN